MLMLGDEGTSWVTGHEAACESVAYPGGAIDPPGRCTCGHDDLRVHAWPAPAGEGVLCKAKSGLLYVLGCGVAIEPNGSLPPAATLVHFQRAWKQLVERLGEGRVASPEFYAYEGDYDGLYVFHEDELHWVENVSDWCWDLPPDALWNNVQDIATRAKSLRLTAPGKECWWEAGS